MPPKKAPAKKLHELAPEVKTGFKINDISKKTFIVGKQFATGGFGRIYTCTEEGKSHQMVMKIEPSTNGPLMTEVVVFNRILKKEMLEAYKKEKKIGWTGLPYLIANGYFTYNSEKMRYMIIPKYAMSLEAAREANGGTLSAKDSMTVSNCILGALEFLHESDYAHADVKAANILLEKQNDYSTAVLVDFGLAHRTTNNIDKPDKKRAHNGTCIFTSTDAHRGNNPSFRGDVEILAYNLIMWLSGTLPWLALESSPDKVFDSKQKFVAGLPSSLQNLLTKQSSAVVGCLSSMFAITMKTNYTDKVDMGKLKKLVRDAIKSGSEQKTNASVKTPKKSSKVVKEEDDEVADFEDEEKETIKPKKKKVTKNVEADKIAKKTQSKIADDDDDEEIIIPSSSRSRRNRLESGEKRSELLPVSGRKTPSRKVPVAMGATSPTDTIAKKIVKKYRRLSANKSSLVPVSLSVPRNEDEDDEGASPEVSTSPCTSSAVRSKRSSEDGSRNAIPLKTPALLSPAIKKAKYKSGISSATKASPTELRRVPGVRNFPKGRRSMLIKETTTKYQEKRAARQTKPTFDDSSCSSEL